MSGPAVCSDKAGDLVGARETSRAQAMQIGANGGGESSSDVNMWSRESRKSSGFLVRPVGQSDLGAESPEPQPLVALASLVIDRGLLLYLKHYTISEVQFVQ